MKDEIRAWWTASLLKQGASAHPVFGERIDVQGIERYLKKLDTG